MSKVMKKNYVKPQSVCLCAEPEQMLLVGTTDVSCAKVSVEDWNEDEENDLGPVTIGFSDDEEW